MGTLLFLGSVGTSEILLIAFIALLLFGGKKIPELMHGLGKGIKTFKDGMNGIEKDINKGLDTDLNNETSLPEKK
ncbi:twin-arginine translocase TatA/TatE family subunit [Phocaeicola barnesiae]|jgi:sec-independent protein translocase protein TatA|uniref:Sec-independent protein translocase protein TatA n=1 Tax=Phocaeicola barnesiae TaxID=376804 RepID=A0AAW5N628_9BACT|nr:twin-arginine translocase TatA/TatE family subunit [Phocaeicola barnesiae]MBS6467802.1 twin-arginine translocase TatA/TatE family subunit [Bacteroides sp.]CDD31724.1 tatA/E family twin arginine-targeting protein translocase [Bacteroides sp. CAG:714]MCF2576375.1 twin-arginine translocase TatA/TatE family subunit [Phocaeicola barnesiae]MCF2598284.1 twin-arginine translocase TatA/TatE family subunit [Phocaeicola barnesiae]MCR8872430.1 twin-arginine translocase TatA/TatE family subunit [Phocaei